MREFIRHPSDIPLAYSLGCGTRSNASRLRNIGEGGLCFESNKRIHPGRSINIQIRLNEHPFETHGEVVWCEKTNSHYDIGVQLDAVADEDSVRMIEQICYIEHYRREVQEKEGRILSGEEAAAEWIDRFADKFPR